MVSNFRTLLVPHDFSAAAQGALVVASRLAAQLGSEVHLLHVIQSRPYFGGGGGAAVPAPRLDREWAVRKAEASLREAIADSALDHPEPRTHVEVGGDVPDKIHEVARELGVDLMVIGTHARGGLARAFFGSTAERAVRGAPCLVLLVPSASEASGG